MKQFNLEEYNKNPNRKVVTRDGRNVRIICTDRVNFDNPVMALVMMKSGIENVYSYRTNGQLFRTEFSNQDLFFAPEKREGWVNVYKAGFTRYTTASIWPTEERAKARALDGYIETVKIEWEE